MCCTYRRISHAHSCRVGVHVAGIHIACAHVHTPAGKPHAALTPSTSNRLPPCCARHQMVNTHALIPAPLVSKPGQRVVNPGSTWPCMHGAAHAGAAGGVLMGRALVLAPATAPDGCHPDGVGVEARHPVDCQSTPVTWAGDKYVSTTALLGPSHVTCQVVVGYTDSCANPPPHHGELHGTRCAHHPLGQHANPPPHGELLQVHGTRCAHHPRGKVPTTRTISGH